MARAPFQVLVFPYQVKDDGNIYYSIFERADMSPGHWQGIAGGGEDGETAEQAARREAEEEAGISRAAEFIKLDSLATIPVIHIAGFQWGDDVLVVPQYCFGVAVPDGVIRLSSEHRQYRWLGYDEARRLLTWESNRNALWELNTRLGRGV